MSRIKIFAPAVLAAAALGTILSPAALGEAAPGSHGCTGNIVASFNHNSGAGGASGNPRASAGPGYFIAGGGPRAVADAVHGAQSLC
jgi:hypothetical protein